MVILSAFPANAARRDSSMFQGVTHRVTADIRPVYNMPTHGFYRGWNDYGKAIPMAASAHLKYSFGLSPESKLGSLFPTAYQGVGVAVHTFFNHEITGTPAILYIFQGTRIADLSRNISLDCEWTLGASYGWKVNEVVGSKCNIYINVGLPFTWHISQMWDFSVGPEYTHFSNGDTTFPNGGANTTGVRVGLTAKFNEPASVKAPGPLFLGKEEYLQDKAFKERITYDILAFGAWRADRDIDGLDLHIINKAFPLGGVHINPLYRLNRYFCVGASTDLTFDRSADINLIINEDTGEAGKIKYPPLSKQTAMGLSVRGEVTMPFFSINLGAGYNFLTGSNDLRGFYSLYSLKGFISERVFLNIGYRLSSVLFTHNLMFGIGVRI